MLMEVKNNIKLIFVSFKYNILKAMDNRISFISQVLGMMLNNGMMIIQWIVLFSLKDNIGGYGFKEILLLWAFASGTFGIAHSFFFNAFNLSSYIYKGKLDAYLVQPKNTLVSTLCSSSTVSALGDILYGFVLLIVLKASLVTWILFTVLIISGGIIIASFATIWHSLSFWITNAEDFAENMINIFINVSTYPDGIFSKEIRWLLLTLIPISFTVYLPIKVLTTLNIPLLLGILVFSLFMALTAFFIFNKGLKRYSSSNLMSARI